MVPWSFFIPRSSLVSYGLFCYNSFSQLIYQNVHSIWTNCFCEISVYFWHHLASYLLYLWPSHHISFVWIQSMFLHSYLKTNSINFHEFRFYLKCGRYFIVSVRPCFHCQNIETYQVCKSAVYHIKVSQGV